MNRRAQSMNSRAAVRVVVIDDDEFECAFLVDILKTAGFNVSSLPSVIGVTNHLVQERVQVVVLDVMMPAMRGDKLAALLRRNPSLPKLGVVLVSSLPEEEITPLLVQAEVDAFVSKANVRSELASVVSSVGNR
jgi:CheY-like chemotaxis protein